jgi:hypothetical protein
MVDAIVEEADPLNVLRRYQALAETAEEILRTDIPRKLMPAFVDLALKVKGKKMRSIAFVTSDQFFSGDPDFAWMQQVVDKATGPKQGGGGPKGDAGTAVKTEDVCAYDPEGADDDTDSSLASAP